MTALLAIAALVGFASNSLLCRAALGSGAIDAASFTAIRLASGALVLAALVLARRPRPVGVGGRWAGAITLFAYAIAFSYAYLALSAATGALILFATVQITMIGVALVRGTRPGPREWIGLATSGGGLVCLLAPGLAAPDPLGALLMAIAGASWGAYSLLGRRSIDPIATTAGNFVRTLPLALIAPGLALASGASHVTSHGALLAVASGALASGLGYSLWYAALPRLAPARAAIIQLAVPVLTALGAAMLLDEVLTVRFALAAGTIIGGIAIATAPRSS